MAANTYRAKPNETKLKERFPGGYAVAAKGKGKNRRFVVTPKLGGAGGPGTPTTPTTPTVDPNDPLGVMAAAKPQLDYLDKQSASHQSWAKDVRKLTESSLQNIYNAREAVNSAYTSRFQNAGSPTNGNAPVVGDSSGGTVTDRNAAQTAANSQYAQNMDKAQVALAGLQGKTDNLNQLDYVTQNLKNYDYYTSQIPALYNEAKQKYTQSLTSAVMDLESKKEIAQIGADARNYGAEQRLIGTLATVQGADSRALTQGQVSMYNSDQRNQTSIQNTNSTNQSRERVAAMNQNTAFTRLRATLANQSSKNAQTRQVWIKKQADAYLAGKPVDIGNGQKLFLDPITHKLLPGATMAGSTLLASDNPNDIAQGVRGWLSMAVSQLYMSPTEALGFIGSSLPATVLNNPTLKKQILGMATKGLPVPKRK
jgi:hypothetical protein